MKRILTILLLSLATVSPALCQEGWIGPTHGVLLLKNGNTLAGAITVSGDAYVVAINEDAVIRVSSKQVQYRCTNLAEAHEYRCGQVSLDTIAGRLEIAEWCMRSELFSEADHHLRWVERSDPENAMGQMSRRRLDSLVQQPDIALTSANEDSPVEAGPAVISDKELEEFTKKFHPQAVGQFATIIQPILLNACSTSQCHGSASTVSDFQLIQSGHGLMPRRLTLRNMKATYDVAQLKNGTIPLLEVLYDTHGNKINTKTNAWPRQLAALRAWAISVQPRGEVRPLKNDVQQVGFQETLTPIPSSRMTPGPSSNAVPSSLPSNIRRTPNTPAPAAAGQSGGYQSRDPFDPEIFNRRHAGQTGR
ncbi:hypothetical protein [Blastopirellula marina]|uniref:SLA1 homology domain-containing protein n=1 Tax=Blastopirellula marina DSM 3645 TaxID=314230 RepID=A3ZW00_9BACT|nr:hypothetical protein [Blastopirellula marina]EAQ79496.1 hypothetical protein DSM3645_03433 [Blastopirellula marina DSM 3645]